MVFLSCTFAPRFQPPRRVPESTRRRVRLREGGPRPELRESEPPKSSRWTLLRGATCPVKCHEQSRRKLRGLRRDNPRFACDRLVEGRHMQHERPSAYELSRWLLARTP